MPQPPAGRRPASHANLTALAAWYAAQCNGDWEHRYGVSIQSTDNPGWWVKIDLAGTALSRRQFEPVTDGADTDGPKGSRWLRCYVTDGVWNGAGDETRLDEILEHFLAWLREP
jgi:hypothetical protein